MTTQSRFFCGCPTQAKCSNRSVSLPASTPASPRSEDIALTVPHRHTIGITSPRNAASRLLRSARHRAVVVVRPRCSDEADAASRKKPKSVIIVFLTGGPSHLDTFDLKPDAPAEIRGEFQPIADQGARPASLRASAASGGAGRQVRRGPLAVAPGEQPPGGHASRADRAPAAGRVLRQGRVARRLAELRRRRSNYLQPRTTACRAASTCRRSSWKVR